MADKTNRRGLGTGLGALFGDDIGDAGSKDILTLPISKVEPRSGQPRYEFDEVALSELSESIKEYGVIQPLTVRKLDSGYYQIIAGERRWRAARLAGLTEVPVRVLEADDRRTQIISLVENLQREDLSPIEEARGFKALMGEYGLTQEEAASSVGKSRPAVANALRLLSLSPDVMELVEAGSLSAGHARALLAVTWPTAQAAAARKVIAQGLSVRQTEQLAARLAKEPEIKSVLPKTDENGVPIVDYFTEAGDDLTRVLARRCKVVEGRKKGRIEIEYYDENDREMLISNLYRMGNSWVEEI